MSSLHPAPEQGVLDHIVAIKRIDVEHAKARLPIDYLRERVQSYRQPGALNEL